MQTLTIPGRSGTLHIKEGKYGEDIYDSYYKRFVITALNPSRIPEIKEWLDGDGILTFGNELDWEYDAYVTGSIEFQRSFRGWHAAELSFEVQPYKKSKTIKRIEFEDRTETLILNEGSVPVESYKIEYPTSSILRSVHINENNYKLILNEAIGYDYVEIKDVVITMPDLIVTYSIVLPTEIIENCTKAMILLDGNANADFRLQKGPNTFKSLGAGAIIYREMSI